MSLDRSPPPKIDPERATGAPGATSVRPMAEPCLLFRLGLRGKCEENATKMTLALEKGRWASPSPPALGPTGYAAYTGVPNLRYPLA